MESKQILYINSNDRDSGTHSNFVYTLDIDQNQNFDRIAVLDATIPKSYYNIQANQNSFTMTDGFGSHTITLTVGNCSRASLRTHIQTLLNNVGNYTYSVSVENIATTIDRGKFIFTVSGNSGYQPQFYFPSESISELIGFNKETTYSFVADTLSSANVINLSHEPTLFIHSDICDEKNSDILQNIPTSTAPPYSYVVWQNYAPETYSKKLRTNASNVFTFQITDENGLEVDLNGVNLVLTIMVYKELKYFDLIKAFIKNFTLKFF